MKFVRFFSNLSLVQLGITNLLLCFLLIHSACRKDTMGHPESATDQTLMQAVERSFESGQLGDLALGASPVFSKSMERSEGGTTFLLTPIEGLQAGNMGANLAFYKDLKGNIQHLLVLWRTADAGYTSEWAPFKGDVAFSGSIAYIGSPNVLLSVSHLENGQVRGTEGINKSLDALSLLPEGSIQERGPFELNGITWEYLQDYWKRIDAFYHDLYTGSIGDGTTYDPNIGIVSGGGALYDQYMAFRTTCSLIDGWVIAAEQRLETHPYDRVDYRLCQLLSGLSQYLDPSEAYCLWKNYQGTAALEGTILMWEQSDKSQLVAANIAAALKQYLDCN